MDTNWLRNELIRIVKEAEGREGGGGIAAFNERAQFTITSLYGEPRVFAP